MLQYHAVAKRKIQRGRIVSPRAYGCYVQWSKKKLPQRVAKILSSTDVTSFSDDESVFEDLQSAYKTKWWPDYGFNGCSTWLTGLERSSVLLKRTEFSEPGLRVFETGFETKIVGNAPSDAIKRLAGEAIKVTSYVPDTTPYLESSAILVAPMRFGAGIK